MCSIGNFLRVPVFDDGCCSVCCQSEGGHRIGNNITRRCKVFPGCRRQVHNTFNTVQHISGFPSGHRHVLESLGTFCGTELRLGTHFLCLISKLLNLRSRSTGNGLDLAHSCLKVRTDLDCSRTNTGYRCCGTGQNSSGSLNRSARHSR